MTALTARWQSVCDEIHQATTSALAQKPVCLIAVSKTFPAADIRALYQAGQRDFGENYIQEFAHKATQLADLDITWHMIGHVQSNKSQLVAEHAHWVHSIDRARIAQRLNAQRPKGLVPLNVCIEINIANEAAKHGIAPEESILLTLAQTIATLPRLTLRGLMCVAKTNSTETELQQQFQRMQALLAFLQDAGFDVDVLSMGMSSDLPVAIKNGATHVRIGRAIFGHRSYDET
ncbi:YggS family pyridoxal phosphate-dependent enzyme [Neisseriaceae bacterium ESL0693]|nr:YggS family pyridoxal phosphate-dependent enzyme [Neisseriaceae bacterium ESL0693]